MRKKENDLLLVCNKFPYGFGESFLETEFPYLHNSFRKIVVLTITDQNHQTRKTPSDVTLLRKSRRISFTEKIKTIVFIIVHFLSFFRLIVSEVKAHSFILKTNKDQDFGNKYIHLIPILDNAFKAFNLKQYIDKNVLPLVQNNSILYAYWQDYSALSLALIKQRTPSYKAVCKTHRGDLYFNANKYHYIPYRLFLSEVLDQIFFISDNGLNYQNRILGKEYDNYIVSRLGTTKINECNNQSQSDEFLIVSCSTLTPVKRVHLIINTLRRIKDKKIKWIHFGDGPLREELTHLAQQKLAGLSNVTYKFMGNVSNSEIHNFYAQNHVHIFINVSDSEGIPVSIMEAMSYGIPAIATDVGGTRELVNNECGRLLSRNFEISELSSIISEELVISNIKKKGRNASTQWQEKFMAIKNFKEFVSLIC